MKHIFTALFALSIATPGICAPKKSNDSMAQLVDLLQNQQEELRLLRDEVKQLNQQVNEMRKTTELASLAHDPALGSAKPVQKIAHDRPEKVALKNKDVAHKPAETEKRDSKPQIKETKHEPEAKPAQKAAVESAHDKSVKKTENKPVSHDEDKTVAKEMTMDLADHAPVNPESQRPQMNSADAYNEARTLLEQRRFAEAEVALTQFIKKYPKDPMLINAHYWLGETHYIRSDYTQAALKFGEAYQAYLDQKNTAYKEAAMSKGPEIMFKLASSLYNIGKYEEAKVTLDELKKEFPKLPGNIQQQSDLLRREIARKARPS